jgi:hypothetical protein
VFSRHARALRHAIVAILAVTCAACEPASDRDPPPSGTPEMPLGATRLEAMARYDYPLADSIHACVDTPCLRSRSGAGCDRPVRTA